MVDDEFDDGDEEMSATEELDMGRSEVAVEMGVGDDDDFACLFGEWRDWNLSLVNVVVERLGEIVLLSFAVAPASLN